VLGITCQGAEWFCLGVAIEFVGLVLVLVDGVARFRAGIFKVENAAAGIRELQDHDGGYVTEAASVERSPDLTTWGDIERMKSDMAALSALTASTQDDIERLDQRLQELLNARFRESLAAARAEADVVRQELNDDLRRSAWRPVVGTILAICGLLLSAWTQVASPQATMSSESRASSSSATLSMPEGPGARTASRRPAPQLRNELMNHTGRLIE
jgi:hypothetical protein